MIRLATEQDLPLVGSIYEEILAEEEKRPASFTNWQRGKYPTVEHARAALEAGTLYVAEEDGEVYGCVNLNGEQLAEYAALNWSVPADPEDVMVIHTLCISPRWAGRGKAREFVAFCEEEARRKGKKVMRLDTYEGNLPANTMYPKLGYTFVGGTEFFFQGFIREILNCYDKKLYMGAAPTSVEAGAAHIRDRHRQSGERRGGRGADRRPPQLVGNDPQSPAPAGAKELQAAKRSLKDFLTE